MELTQNNEVSDWRLIEGGLWSLDMVEREIKDWKLVRNKIIIKRSGD